MPKTTWTNKTQDNSARLLTETLSQSVSRAEGAKNTNKAYKKPEQLITGRHLSLSLMIIDRWIGGLPKLLGKHRRHSTSIPKVLWLFSLSLYTANNFSPCRRTFFLEVNYC